MNKLHGLFEGVVRDNDDPEHENRVRVFVPGVWREDEPVSNLPWARIFYDTGGQGSGENKTPQVGNTVGVMFFNGHPDHPAVVGVVQNNRAVRNANLDAYIAGDDEKSVDGKQVRTLSGAKKTTARDITEEARGKLERTAASTSETTNGPRTVEAKSETKTIKGGVTKTILGLLRTKALNGVLTAIVGDAKVSTTGEAAVTFMSGFSLRTYLTDILLETLGGLGNITLAVKDPTGLIELAKVEVALTGITLQGPLINLAASQISMGASPVTLTCVGSITFAGTEIKLGAGAVDPVALGAANEANWTQFDAWASVVQGILSGLGAPVVPPWVVHQNTAATATKAL